MFKIKVFYKDPDPNGDDAEEIFNISRTQAIGGAQSISVLSRVDRVEVTGPNNLRIATYEGGERTP